MARIGQMFQATADDIYRLDGPSSFTAEQRELFKGKVAQKVAVMERKAVESYLLCIKKAQELRWFGEWSDLAERQLATLSGEHRADVEIRSRPDHFGDGIVEASFVRGVERVVGSARVPGSRAEAMARLVGP